MSIPTPSDIARATEFVDGDMRKFLDCDPDWLARHRDDAIRQTSVAEMQMRQHSERKLQTRRRAA